MTKKTVDTEQVPQTNEAFLEDFVPYVMYRITNQLNLDLQNDLRPLKINVSRWRVLAALNAQDGRTMGDLCKYTMMEQSSLSRVIDRMVEEKLVTRQLQKEDNRYVLVLLTDKGRGKFQEIYPKVFSRQGTALEGFSDGEHNQLLSFLRRIGNNINI